MIAQCQNFLNIYFHMGVIQLIFEIFNNMYEYSCFFPPIYIKIYKSEYKFILQIDFFELIY